MNLSLASIVGWVDRRHGDKQREQLLPGEDILMQDSKTLVDLVLKAVALAMAVASIVLGILSAAPLETNVTLLGIGLLALALVALRGHERSAGE